MKFPKHLLIAAVLLMAIPSFSQIQIEGDLKLGDTTQIHKLLTKSGDSFTGRVVSYDKSVLHFLYRNTNLEFKIDEIQSITVFNNNRFPRYENIIPSPDSSKMDGMMTVEEGKNYIWHLDYKITNSSGIEHLGKLTKMNEYGATLEQSTRKKNTVNYRDINEIALLGKRITTNPNTLTACHRLRTKKGSSFTGQLLYFNQEELGFLLKNGSEITVKKEDFHSLVLEKNQGGGTTSSQILYPQKDSYNQHRLFFSPSALMLKKNVREFRSMILYNTIEKGLSDHVTIGGGLFSLLVVNVITGKIKFGASMGDLVHVAVGAQGAFAFSTFGDGATLGLFYGSVAVGSKDRFLNVTVGRGRSSDDNRGTTGYSFGGSFRTNEHWRVYFEYLAFQDPYYNYYNNSYYYDQRNGFINFGLSWFKDQHQVDFGVFISDNFGESQVGFPVAAYSYKF